MWGRVPGQMWGRVPAPMWGRVPGQMWGGSSNAPAALAEYPASQYRAQVHTPQSLPALRREPARTLKRSSYGRPRSEPSSYLPKPSARPDGAPPPFLSSFSIERSHSA